ncbi:MAG TPA: hypothetical protein VK972_05785, partial [Wenzhouxiangella sp.]|nr:hypothetical protein [Wenzhouxiangella sp.]
MTEAPGTRVVAADSTLSRLTGAVLFATLALGLVVPNAVDAGLVSLVLLALAWLARSGRWRQPEAGPLEYLYLALPAAFILIWLAAWALHGLPEAGTGMAERLPRLLAIVPLYLFVRRVDGLDGAWWNGLVAGCLVAGGYALWYAWTGQQSAHGARVPGPTNPIYFGGLSLAFA